MGTYFTDLVNGQALDEATFNAVLDELDAQLVAQQAEIDGFSGGELGAPSELTIASGAITVTQANHTVDTEGNAASDDLDTINGLDDGEMLFISAENAARTVVVKHATGNIRLNGGADFELDNDEKGLLLVGSGALVIGVGVPVSVGAGSGTVTSVGLSMPSVFAVASSPVTTSGTLGVTFAGGQTANQVLASPDASSGAVGLRALVADDLPTIPISKGGTGQTAATAAFNALSPVTTAGDLIVRGVTNNERLGVGDEGDVLTIDSGVPVWAAASGGNFATGSYTGNATDDRAITVGFEPRVVIVARYGGGTQTAVFKFDMFGTESKLMSDGSMVTNGIKSFTSTGFVLGVYSPVNGNGLDFGWAAWG